MIKTEINLGEFRRAITAVQEVSHKALADQINQRVMNVAVRSFKALPPSDVNASRAKVKQYMDAQLSQAIRRVEKEYSVDGMRRVSARYIKSGRGKDQLTRKILIAQMLNKRAGKKGLYGNAMRLAAARLSRVSQISQGFLKSVFLPIITGMYGVVKFRPPVSLTANVSRWPGSAGYGKVRPARKGINPSALLEFGVTLKPGQEGKVKALYQGVVQQSINDETREMYDHRDAQMEKIMQKELDRIK